MKKIVELVPKPSDAIKAMWAGLNAQSKRDDFIINMGTFGGQNRFSKQCFGCAATCTIQQISGIDFRPDQDKIETYGHRAKILGFEKVELAQFENCIDEFRWGNLDPLLFFYAERTNLLIDMRQIPDAIALPDIRMTSDDWMNYEAEVMTVIQHLEEKGL